MSPAWKGHVSAHADGWIRAFLERALTPSSVAVVLSDHGLHYGKHLARPAAASHQTNPPLLILWPKTRAAGAAALRRATAATLVTHLDVHRFLSALATDTVPPASLLSSGFPLYRTCPDVGIPPLSCRCVLSGECSPAAAQAARVILERRIHDARHDYCKAASPSDFRLIACTGGGAGGTNGAHRAVFARQRACHACTNRIYELLFRVNVSGAGGSASGAGGRASGAGGGATSPTSSAKRAVGASGAFDVYGGASFHQLTAHDPDPVFRRRCPMGPIPPPIGDSHLCICKNSTDEPAGSAVR